MKNKLIIIILMMVFVACGSTSSDTGNSSEIVVCDCDDLLFDQPYNNFYITEPREGYTGACEKYYANGQLALIKHFTEGKVDGEIRSYYENGQLNEEKFFEMSFQQGDFKKYDSSGELIFHAKFERGNQVETILLKGTN